jgi:hypothetical protein
VKVGILTFHDGLNHGAYLQAYCTMLTLRALGHDPVVINYKNREHWLKEDVRPWLAYRRPIRFIDRWGKQRAFKRDHKAMPLTVYTHDPDQVQKWHFDAVIVGSDVVWDTGIFGYDSLYFGDLNTDRRIAYAVSCGAMNFDGTVAPEVESGIRRFDAISVRDANTEAMVCSVTGSRPVRVVDPVFLPEHLDDLVGKSIPFNEPYLLVYGGHFSVEDGELIREFATKRRWRVISVGYRNSWADKNVMSIGPLKILDYFKNAAFVFSGTFHGTVFSLRFRKKFAVVLNDAIKNKAVSLLEAVACSDRAGINVRSMLATLDEPVNHSNVEQWLISAREASLSFLCNALK